MNRGHHLIKWKESFAMSLPRLSLVTPSPNFAFKFLKKVVRCLHLWHYPGAIKLALKASWGFPW